VGSADRARRTPAIGQLAEVRATDLRFTDHEAAALLVDTEGLKLDAQAVESLGVRTEGWAAGLYLAALWLRGRGGPQDDVERFAGDNRHVVDYLSEVVLDQFRRWLELAERGIAHAEQKPTLGVDVAALRTRVQQVGSAFGYRDIPAAAVTAARTARVESEGDGALRVVVLANLAFLLYLSDDPGKARHVLSEAIRDPLAQRRPYGFITALTTSALIAPGARAHRRGPARQRADRDRPWRATPTRRGHDGPADLRAPLGRPGSTGRR
jgi:hypothetical protein